MNEARVQVTGRLVFGLVVIVLGILFTMDNLGLIDAGEVLRWWPAVPVGYGMIRLAGFSSRRNITVGALCTVIGGWLLLREFGIVRHDIWDFLPLVLVLLGVSLVARSLGGGGAAGPSQDASSRMSTFAIWSSLERKVVSNDFRGGDMTAIMAGQEIDFRGAKLAGNSAVIDVLVMMAGLDLRIPEDWKVTSEALLVMGGLEDHTKPPAGEVQGHLILRGVVLMGGIEVKN